MVFSIHVKGTRQNTVLCILWRGIEMFIVDENN